MKKRVISIIVVIMTFMTVLSSCADGGEPALSVTGDAPAFETIKDEVTAEEPSVPDTPAKQVVKFFAAGDNIIHECVYLDAMTVAASVGAPSEYYFTSMYDNYKDVISSADLAFINAEGPLDTDYAPSGYPSFNAPREAGDALVDVGFDIVNLANNHLLDFNCGVGMKATINYWKTKNVLTVGAYEGEADYNTIRTVEKNGIKIAILSYTYGTNGNYLDASDTSLYVPYINDADITRQIAEAKSLADCVLVSMHWGEENTFNVTSEQERLAKLIADAGADAIIGHHSHTIQPVKWVDGASGNKTLVIYSLGNFLHTQIKSMNLVGGTVTFDIVKNAETGEVSIEDPVFDPSVCHYTANTAVMDSLDLYKRENVKIYRLVDYTDALAAEHGCQEWDKFNLSTLRDYVMSTIDPKVLTDDWKWPER
ncbi:MAG: CapA family protein [Clostridia bacterium]|nr:CapA family protein [Clostridia bacterium]